MDPVTDTTPTTEVTPPVHTADPVGPAPKVPPSVPDRFVRQFVNLLNGEPKSEKLAFLHHAARQYIDSGIEPDCSVFDEMEKCCAVNEQSLVPIETKDTASLPPTPHADFEDARDAVVLPSPVNAEKTLAQQVIDHAQSMS